MQKSEAIADMKIHVSEQNRTHSNIFAAFVHKGPYIAERKERFLENRL